MLHTVVPSATTTSAQVIAADAAARPDPNDNDAADADNYDDEDDAQSIDPVDRIEFQRVLAEPEISEYLQEILLTRMSRERFASQCRELRKRQRSIEQQLQALLDATHTTCVPVRVNAQKAMATDTPVAAAAAAEAAAPTSPLYLRVKHSQGVRQQVTENAIKHAFETINTAALQDAYNALITPNLTDAPTVVPSARANKRKAAPVRVQHASSTVPSVGDVLQHCIERATRQALQYEHTAVFLSAARERAKRDPDVPAVRRRRKQLKQEPDADCMDDQCATPQQSQLTALSQEYHDVCAQVRTASAALSRCDATLRAILQDVPSNRAAITSAAEQKPRRGRVAATPALIKPESYYEQCRGTLRNCLQQLAPERLNARVLLPLWQDVESADGASDDAPDHTKEYDASGAVAVSATADNASVQSIPFVLRYRVATRKAPFPTRELPALLTSALRLSNDVPDIAQAYDAQRHAHALCNAALLTSIRSRITAQLKEYRDARTTSVPTLGLIRISPRKKRSGAGSDGGALAGDRDSDLEGVSDAEVANAEDDADGDADDNYDDIDVGAMYAHATRV